MRTLHEPRTGCLALRRSRWKSRGMAVVSSLALAATLAGCASVQQTTDQAARNAAKTVMPQALAVYLPEVPKELYQPFTDCVVDNADTSELQALSGDVVTGIDANTGDTIKSILARAETQDCLRAAAPDAAAAPIIQTSGG